MLLLAICTELSRCAFQTIANFTDKYSAVFSIEDDPEFGEDSYMRVTLIYRDVPIQLEDMGGMWLGIGFGRQTMLGAVLVMCQWNDTSGKTRCRGYLGNSTVRI